MSRASDLIRRLVPGLWAGVLLCIALVATPSVFAVLSPADAGRVVGRIFAREAEMSLVLAGLLMLLERREAREQGRLSGLSAGVLWALLALFCTVAGYYALQPMMAQARAGEGAWSFGQLHAVSLAFFGLKTVAVLVLAGRALQTR